MAQYPQELGRQINAMPVGPAAEPQRREFQQIVAQLNELASHMKQWAAQVEGFASLIDSGSFTLGETRAPEPNEQGYAPPSQQHYRFHVQQFQQGRQHHGVASPSYPVGQLPPESSFTDASEKQGKRRRKSDAPKRKKDPLAPKRPPSAYILYQNDVRKQMQDKYPELSYSDVLGKISESWQTLEEDRKKVYLDMVERDKVRYEDEKLRYHSGQDVPTKPVARRPLSSLRRTSDPEINPDADVDAEADGDEIEEETEGPEPEEHEPDAKRTRIEMPVDQRPALDLPDPSDHAPPAKPIAGGSHQPQPLERGLPQRRPILSQSPGPQQTPSATFRAELSQPSDTAAGKGLAER